MDGDTEMLKARIDNMVTEIRLLQQDNRAAAQSRAEMQARFEKIDARLDKQFICQIVVLVVALATLIVVLVQR